MQATSLEIRIGTTFLDAQVVAEYDTAKRSFEVLKFASHLIVRFDLLVYEFMHGMKPMHFTMHVIIS